MASPILRLTLSNFRAMPTSIGCVPGRNQRYQSVAGSGEFPLSPSPAVSKPKLRRFTILNLLRRIAGLLVPNRCCVTYMLCHDLSKAQTVDLKKCGCAH